MWRTARGSKPSRTARSAALFYIDLPIVLRRLDERLAVRGYVMRFAEEVRERKAQIEAGIAPVDHLVVEQHQPPGVDEHILGAVVAVDEGQ